MENSATTALYDLLVTRDFEPEILDSQGKPVTDPGQAELFSFDWKTENKNYGTVVVLLGAENELEVYYGDNLGRAMEAEDRQDWYDFLAQMKQFASRNMLTFNVNNINRLKYTMQGMAAIKEGLFEGYYGNRRMSYSDQPKRTKLVIKHDRTLGEGDKRYRHIESLFVETAEGERFRVPSRNLAHGKMLARHVSEGGTPYDAFGQHITDVVSEMATISRFMRAARNRGFQGAAADMVESAVRHYNALKTKAKRMISQRGYREERERFDPADIPSSERTVEAIRTMFIENNLDQRIEEALPILARIAVPVAINALSSSDDEMNEVTEFESWADGVTEATGARPDTAEQQARLEQIMAEPLPVGPDATNATEQLHDLLGDDELFDRLADLAARDPDADARPVIQQRMSEMGIELTAPAGTAEVSENTFGTPIGGAMDRPLHTNSVEFAPVDVSDPPSEGSIHSIDNLDYDRLPGSLNLHSPDDAYSNTLYYKDPVSDGVFSFYYAYGAPRIRGTAGMSDSRVAEIAKMLSAQPTSEDLDVDGVMMTRPSNMSSESRDLSDFNRLIELAKG